MRIKIINPNTTASFTERCLIAGRAVAAPGTVILAGQPSRGTPSVESYVDEATAILGVIEQVRAGEAEGVDGYVIACFGDTGLEAAREVAKGPVVGMTEAALYAAALIAPVFSIVTLPPRTRAFAERVCVARGSRKALSEGANHRRRRSRLRRRGVCSHGAFYCRSPPGHTRGQRGGDYSGLRWLQPLVEPLSLTLGVPVIEGVAAAVKLAEALVAMRLATSKRGAWAIRPRRPSAPEDRAEDHHPQRARPDDGRGGH